MVQDSTTTTTTDGETVDPSSCDDDRARVALFSSLRPVGRKLGKFFSKLEPSIACLKIAHIIFFCSKICCKVAKEANCCNLPPSFFISKFFSKFSRVTNRHLARINLLKNLRLPPHHQISAQSRHHRSLVRRASAARAILLANAASLYSSQQAAQAVPSQFVAKSGERDGSGASSRTPTLLIFDEKFAISSHRQIRPQKREIVRGNQAAD